MWRISFSNSLSRRRCDTVSGMLYLFRFWQTSHIYGLYFCSFTKWVVLLLPYALHPLCQQKTGSFRRHQNKFIFNIQHIFSHFYVYIAHTNDTLSIYRWSTIFSQQILNLQCWIGVFLKICWLTFLRSGSFAHSLSALNNRSEPRARYAGTSWPSSR